MSPKFFLLALFCPILTLPATAGAQPEKPKTPAGSIKIKVEVEVEGVLTLTGQEFSILVGKAEYAPPFLTGQEMEQRWVLDFASAKELAPLARELVGKVVAVHGKCVLLGITTFSAPKPVPTVPGGGPHVEHGSYSLVNLEKKVTVQGLTVVNKPAPAPAEKPAAKPGVPDAVPMLLEDLLKMPMPLAKLPPDALKKLAASKVPTADAATDIAFAYKFKNAGGILAEERWDAVGLIITKDDLIWVVRFTKFGFDLPGQQYIWEVWVSSTSGAAQRNLNAGKIK